MAEEIIKYIILGAILIILLSYFGRIFSSLTQSLIAKFKEFKVKRAAKSYIKEKKKEEKALSTDRFFGLFEINVKDYDDEEILKKDCCSIIKDKLKLKYLSNGLQINATDKIFFNCSDFSITDDLVDDLVKLYNFFVDINKKRRIHLCLKFSLWAKAGHAGMQEAFRILSEINNLDFENSVMANDIFYRQYKKQGLKGFNFHPHGVVRLIENDEDIELYRLLKSSVSQTDNK